jgi:hypothetical protein
MSIIVSVKIHDGIVMAADSATTFYTAEGRPGQIYENANKIVNLVKGLPIGVMTCGAGGIGNASIATLLKDLRSRLCGDDQAYQSWKIETNKYTMEHVADKVREFFTEKAQAADFKFTVFLRICGYSANRPLPEVWDVVLQNSVCVGPTSLQPEDNIGPRWVGECEALDRLVLGRSPRFVQAATSVLGLSEEKAVEARDQVVSHLYQQLILPAAPIQDAIDLARFMVETTKGFIRFSVDMVKTVGGPTEIAAITKHEGFKWVQRKHFFPRDINALL